MRRKHPSVLEENTYSWSAYVDTTSGIHRNALSFIGIHHHAQRVTHPNKPFRKKVFTSCEIEKRISVPTQL